MEDELNVQNVAVTDINMSFGSMVSFMVRWAIATIPALIILMFIGAIFAGIFSGILGSMF